MKIVKSIRIQIHKEKALQNNIPSTIEIVNRFGFRYQENNNVKYVGYNFSFNGSNTKHWVNAKFIFNVEDEPVKSVNCRCFIPNFS